MTSSSIEMELAKIMAQMELHDLQTQRQSAVNKDCLQRLHSIGGGLRPDGRRLLGRSMTTTTMTGQRTPASDFFFGDALDDDSPTDMSEVFHVHRKLDRSVSEPHAATILGARGGGGGSCSSTSSSSTASSSASASNRYKTELCRPYEESGSCKYGEKCQFAHGRHELRNVARHPKYKTDLCKTYHTTGLCPYGPRCHFIHNDEERYLNLVNRYLLQQQMTDSLIEKAQLVRQQQVIAAALATQKALSQQPGGGCGSVGVGLGGGGGGRQASMRQMSADGSISDPRFQFPLFGRSSDPVGSSTSDDSSSLTDSPNPSPTSSMFSDDPTAAAGAGGFGSLFQGQNGAGQGQGQGQGGGFGGCFGPSDVKFCQMTQQQQQQRPQQTDDETRKAAILLLMAQIQQQSAAELDPRQKLDSLISYLLQKNPSSAAGQQQTAATMPSSSTTASVSPSLLMYSNGTTSSPYSPPPASLSGAVDFMTSRDSACFSFAYPTVEL